MRVGIDSFTIRELNLNPYEMIDYLKERNFEGIQFGCVRALSATLDIAELKKIKAYADAKDMYIHVGVSPVNPVICDGGICALEAVIKPEIEAAAAVGWHELHSLIETNMLRYEHAVPWKRHVDGCIELINRLRPVLEKNGSRINIETHGETTFDILRVINATGPHLTGVCLDTANTFVNAEDPVLATKRVAPYTHLTHTKDAIVCFCEEGLLRQGKPPGMGNVRFDKILPVLAEYSPDLPLSIEDHKWLFKARIFEPDWIELNPDLTPYELGQTVKYAWETQQKLFNGDIPPIDEYEKTAYIEELEERISFGRDYLNRLLKELNLQNI